MLEEGKLVTRTSLQVALNRADSAARVMASAITMHRCSWLQLSGLHPEVQQTIQDLPFESLIILSQKMDKTLYNLTDSRASFKSLRIYKPLPKKIIIPPSVSPKILILPT